MKTLPNLTLPLNGNLTPPELRARLGNGERFELVDVRTHPEFAAGRIAGARLLPLDELESRVRDWDRNLPMICIGRSGRRSAQAAARLARLGFARVHQLEGGLLAWKRPVCRWKRTIGHLGGWSARCASPPGCSSWRDWEVHGFGRRRSD